MNYSEKQKINQIEKSKQDIIKAKEYHEDSITNMNNLEKFISNNIKIDILKNAITDISKYKKYMNNNNDKLNEVIRSLDKDISGIKAEAEQREAEEKRKKEEAKRKAQGV